MFNKLRFFRGTEYDMNLVQDTNGIWNGTVYLDEVSTGLYETVNIFILEECVYLSDPFFNKPLAEGNSSYSFRFRWQDTNESSLDIMMYNAQMQSGIPVVNVLDTDEKILADWSHVDTIDSNGYKVISQKTPTALQVNIALKSELDGRHTRDLAIYAFDGTTETQIALISFYGEVVAEDERLAVLLQNFGASLGEADFILFKDHDVSEQSPDFILLNQKRKELLLELHNIKPFVGTYKAILNAIDFFGYDKLTLKEYWMNVDYDSSSFGKLHAIPVPNSTSAGDIQRKKMTVQVPSSTMKKTSRFSLVYRLNEPINEFDEWDIQKVKEVYDFTPEEILIKLYGLKNKLQKEYLPLNAKIIDITAEADFFTQKNINIWNNQNPISYFSEGHRVAFNHFPSNRTLYIEDLALVYGTTMDQNDPLSSYDTFLNLPFDGYANLTEAQLLEMRDTFEEFYAEYDSRDLSTFNYDIPVGCPIILDGVESFDDIWDEAQFTWQDAIDQQITWNNWWKRWIYEVEWVVTGPNGYNFEARGPITGANEEYLYVRLPLVLPYIGNYDVEMRTYDLYGHRSHYRKKEMFTVRPKEIELYGLYKWLESSNWQDLTASWSKSGGYWENPQNNITRIQENPATLYLTLDRANYLHNEDQGIRFSTVRRYVDILSETGFSETTGPYRWDLGEFRWMDSEHLTWNSTRVGPDLAASFKIVWINEDDVLEISSLNPTTNLLETGSITITSTTPVDYTDLAAWQAITDELNASTNAVIKKFSFNLVYQELFDNLGNSTGYDVKYIQAVGKAYSRTYDFETVTLLPDGIIDGEVHQVTYNPTYDDTRVFKDFAEVERSTHLTIAADSSKMAGMKNPVWKIVNESNPEINDIYYNSMWLTYIFQKPGYYSIELKAEDTYGNTNVTRRNMIKVK